MSITDSDTIPILKDLESACNDYASYASINTTKLNVAYESQIDSLLGELDEYCEIMDLIRSDTNLCMDTLLPRIKNQCDSLDSTFKQIDRMKNAMSVISENVDQMSALVDKTESDLKTPSKLKSMFMSLMSKKKEVNRRCEFKPIPIFSTKQLLEK